MQKEDVRSLRKNTFLYSFASAFLFGLIAHGYCYFNLTYSHDSLLVYQHSDTVDQISLGRVLLPAYLRLRGDFYAPWLVGALSLAFLGIAVYFTVRLLGLKNKVHICLVSGVLATSVSLTLTNATYLKDADVYMLSLLLAAGAAYLCSKPPHGWLLAAVPLCMSIGLYQAFFQVAVFLAMVLVVKRILERSNVKEVLLTSVKAVAFLVLGLVLYYILLQIVLRATGIPLANSYNGLSQVGKFGSLSAVLQLLGNAYAYPIAYSLAPETFNSGTAAVLNVLLLVLSAALLAWLAWVRRVRGWNLALLAADVLLMPFGMNVIYFISQGMVHLLMVFSFFFSYAFSAMLLEMFLEDTARSEGKPVWLLRRALQWTVPCILGVLIFNSVVYANQAYLKKDLEYQATLSVMTRVVDRIEQTEGYAAGETPVVLVGSLAESRVSMPREGLRELSSGTGLAWTYSVTYDLTYRWYFDRILAYPINLLGSGDAQEWARRSEVAEMPAFPDAGSCRMVDGVVVVRLS